MTSIINKVPKVSFISIHTIQEINKILNQKIKILRGQPGDFIYFDETIPYGYFRLNRMGKGKLYYRDSQIPIDWPFVDGATILAVYNAIKTNKFYVHFRTTDQFNRVQYLKTRINDRKKLPVPLDC